MSDGLTETDQPEVGWTPPAALNLAMRLSGIAMVVAGLILLYATDRFGLHPITAGWTSFAQFLQAFGLAAVLVLASGVAAIWGQAKQWSFGLALATVTWAVFQQTQNVRVVAFGLGHHWDLETASLLIAVAWGVLVVALVAIVVGTLVARAVQRPAFPAFAVWAAAILLMAGSEAKRASFWFLVQNPRGLDPRIIWIGSAIVIVLAFTALVVGGLHPERIVRVLVPAFFGGASLFLSVANEEWKHLDQLLNTSWEWTYYASIMLSLVAALIFALQGRSDAAAVPEPPAQESLAA